MIANLKESITLKIILVYILIISSISFILYKTMPSLLNYAPEVIEKGYIEIWGRPSYTSQFIVMSLFAIIIGIGSIIITLKKICITKSRTCIHAPFLIFALQSLIPLLITFTAHKILKTPNIMILKISIVVFTFTSTSSIISLILSRILIKKIIERQKIKKIQGLKINISLKLFIQIIPISLLLIFINSVLNYNTYFKEKSNHYYEFYQNQLLNLNINIDDLTKDNIIFKNDSDESDVFLIDPNNKIITAGNKNLSNSFYLYLKDISLKKKSKFSRVYEYGNESIQGIVTTIKENNKEYIFGIKYYIDTNKEIKSILFNIFILIIFNIFILYFISINISNDIKYVSKKLNYIALTPNKSNLSKQIYITSNDEIGELIVSFNQIQNLVKNQIEKIEADNKLLTEQEKLSTLGILAGGMAHDINNPTSAIKTGVFSLDHILKNFLKTNNKEVFEKRMQEIIDTLNIAVERIFNIVNSVKSHTRNLQENKITEFSLNDLINKTLILTNHLLKKNNCTCKISGEIDISIQGDESKLSQVITNLLINAIEAYESGGEIEINLSRQSEKTLIKITDYAGGIKGRDKDSLFKDIITTKKNGSGLGLFVSYKIITSFFKGKLWFDTEDGKGTTFSILI